MGASVGGERWPRRGADGAEPVLEFIDALPIKHQVSVLNQIERLNLCDAAHPHLPFPHSSQIDGELRELRCHRGRDLYRILYRRSGRFLILLHIFLKKTKAVPEADKRIAVERWDDFTARMDAARRVPPRAMGRDAP